MIQVPLTLRGHNPDVGSLAHGGALAALAILSRTEGLMAVVGGVFILGMCLFFLA